MAERVRIYEVGPRDGLQNESTPILTADKLRYIELLADAGLTEIEATSFVSPKAIPQLADADELLAALSRRSGVRYPVLVPNERGMARAEAAGVDAIAVFTAATDAFTTHNIGMTVPETDLIGAELLEPARDLHRGLRVHATRVRAPERGRHIRPPPPPELASPREDGRERGQRLVDGHPDVVLRERVCRCREDRDGVDTDRLGPGHAALIGDEGGKSDLGPPPQASHEGVGVRQLWDGLRRNE